MISSNKITGWVLFCLIFILSGCVYKEEPNLMIDTSWHSEPPEVQIVRPKISPSVSYLPREWYPPSYLEKRWLAIVIHHSATENGNATIFDRIHKDNNWDGVGYDFVIGNGTDSGNGQVEVTFRWRQQKTGAHCKTPNNWANENAVGICLVGDFNQTAPTEQQMQSLVKLVRFMQQRYSIPTSKIYGHNTTPGARPTDCPGSRFPMARLKSML